MSGNFGKLKYDECAYNQYVRMTIEPGMYNHFLNRFENNVDSVIDKSCNKNANIKNDIKSINSEILDIDSELKLYTYRASTCAVKKYLPKKLNCVNDVNQCDTKNIVVVPKICDRLINPTNMKMPKYSGLVYK